MKHYERVGFWRMFFDVALITAMFFLSQDELAIVFVTLFCILRELTYIRVLMEEKR